MRWLVRATFGWRMPNQSGSAELVRIWWLTRQRLACGLPTRHKGNGFAFMVIE